MIKLQHRGHCQVCGRIQVASRHRVAKHGYTVPNGYFRGICQGSEFGRRPLQVDRFVTDGIIKAMNDRAGRSELDASALRSGITLPERVMVDTKRDPATGKRVHIYVRWGEAPLFRQREQVEREAGEHESNARFARSHAKMLTELAQAVHGTQLIDREAEELARVAVRKAKSAPIAGAFRTKAAQKSELEGLNRQFSKLRTTIMDRYLAEPGRVVSMADPGFKMYNEMPFDLHCWRAKHAANVLDKYPDMYYTVESIGLLVSQRNEIKARPVIK